MTTPSSGGCTPDGSVPVTARQLGFEAGDAARQCGELGRTPDQPYTIVSEARVINVNQDVSTLGAADAASGLSTQRAGISMTPAPSPQFTRGD